MTQHEQDVRTELERVLDSDRVTEIIKHRRQIGQWKSFTPRAARHMASEMEKTGRPNEAAELMLNMGWRGFKAEWMPPAPQPTVSPTYHKPFKSEPERPDTTPEQRARNIEKLERLKADISRNAGFELPGWRKRQAELRERSERVRSEIRHRMAGRG